MNILGPYCSAGVYHVRYKGEAGELIQQCSHLVASAPSLALHQLLNETSVCMCNFVCADGLTVAVHGTGTDLSAYEGALRRRAALAAPMLRTRISREAHVTLGAVFRLAPWKVGSSLLGPVM